MGKTQQTLKKCNGVHFSKVHKTPKTRKKSDSFTTHYEHHFKYTMSHTNLYISMAFIEIKYINPIEAINTSTKPNYNIYMDKC